MPASQRLKVLSVRLPEPEVRRVKSIAARRGISLQEAVRQALEAW
ncbi:MAG: ribbon-helix-helix protein, CopG family, partial [Terriglobia bacterium]